VATIAVRISGAWNTAGSQLTVRRTGGEAATGCGNWLSWRCSLVASRRGRIEVRNARNCATPIVAKVSTMRGASENRRTTKRYISKEISAATPRHSTSDSQ
jgi:hypothetical protein